ncbi:hypothetical protein SAMN04488550_0809 [Gordonia malaquae]|jgi:uncharacterized membrane protein YeaQ/YmgE (transglycosylase-associated protein family)|uniref:GlsB/YeaQ/YmgE family stress response membrane protein n=1 Tax=Gordonia malaquae NBRC 108250 TaxID=1223542 RepID=M3UK00_GORML|nr:hypothetical protein [Gordonia malaquae]GAC79895.1 hypothetical protein GM1_013_00280 [Gordonia malaquae NBRC 108250]SEB79351.1 hypothetical protein SAMN04488550_0809 [Gordonia malaquae]
MTAALGLAIGWGAVGGAVGWLAGRLLQESTHRDRRAYLLVGATGGVSGGSVIRTIGVDAAEGGWLFSILGALAGGCALLLAAGLCAAIVRSGTEVDSTRTDDNRSITKEE